jgi:hypothetical protein
MARSAVQSATALPASPQDDRRKRMRQYTIAMSIRTICFLLVVIVPDWWRFVFAVGAIVLPYFAVVLANTGGGGALDRINPAPAPAQRELEQRPQ